MCFWSNEKYFEMEKITENMVISYRLADSVPCSPQSVDRSIVECSTDLKHSVVVMQTPADVRHCSPLLYPLNPGLQSGGRDYIGHHEPTHLEQSL